MFQFPVASTSNSRLHVLATILMFFAAGTTFIGCAKNNPVASNPQSGIVPMRVGNTWTYNSTVFKSTGSVVNQSTITCAVSRDTTVAGQDMFQYGLHCIDARSVGYPPVVVIVDSLHAMWCANVDSGFIQYTALSGNPSANSSLLFKYPVNQGATYQSMGVSNYQRSSFSVLASSSDTLVNVAAGSFHCIRYQFFYQNYLMDDYFVCPAVGLVKLVAYYGYDYPASAQAEMSVQELTNYAVK